MGVTIERILEILDEIEIAKVGWEDDDDIITFNGMPIGGTVSRRSNLELDRWWPSMKKEIAQLVYLRLLESRSLGPDPDAPIEVPSCPLRGSEVQSHTS